ncbi:conserved hypothetical protein [Acidianus hospitalis W1]|uniref:Plasmid stabilization system n=2 Tax=Acidianus hospitalis TaxID=563177 RepID=F4B520_ACIHW|nr:conserved hypothetical protein [Acidianus hospitalis W1]
MITTIIIITTIIPNEIIYEKERFLNMFSISFVVSCEKWELRFSMRKARDYREFMQYTADNFSDKLVMLILEKLELLRKDPLKYAREKLGEDKYNNTMFSIEVTRDIRILYSVNSKNCIVFIWEIGSHKKVYGHDP